MAGNYKLNCYPDLAGKKPLHQAALLLIEGVALFAEEGEFLIGGVEDGGEIWTPVLATRARRIMRGVWASQPKKGMRLMASKVLEVWERGWFLMDVTE